LPVSLRENNIAVQYLDTIICIFSMPENNPTS
jgi:hypothetical protein